MKVSLAHIFAASLLALPPLSAVQQLPAAKPRQLSSPEEVPEGLAKSDWSSIRAAYEAGRHAFQPVEGGWQARNPGQQWTTHFDGRGFLAKPKDADWQWGLEFKSYGFGDHQTQVTGTPSARADGQRLTYQWNDTVQEWFVNDQRGLEHGFIITERPATGEPASSMASPLSFTLATRGSLRPGLSADAQTVHFRDGSNAPVLNYSGLKVWDADGKILPSRFEAAGENQIRLMVDEVGARYPLTIDPIAQQAYLKAGNNGGATDDHFGYSVSVSGDTVVVGAYYEDSSTTGVNTTPNESAINSGAAYVFIRSGTTWSQQAYLKASNTCYWFGYSVSVAGDTIVVGAYLEASSSTGVNSMPNESASGSGAAYVFTRSGTTWSQQAYLKASNTGANDNFGYSVSVSGETVVIGGVFEDSSTTGVNGSPNESASNSGAAYVFTRSGTTWSQQAYLKASNTGLGDQFGSSISVSGDTLVVSSPGEDSSTTGINTTPNENANASGAAYVFTRSGTTWSQQAYLKPSNTGAGDVFGISVAVSGDTVVVGATGEASSTTGVNSTPNESAGSSGAAYVFTRSGTTWSQQAYLKASNTGGGDLFGTSVAVSGDTVVVGAPYEASSSTGVNSTPNESSSGSGASYVFKRSGTIWSQQAYLKAANTPVGPGANDYFGFSVAASGDTVVVGATGEDSGTTGVNSTSNENASSSGAAYVFIRSGTTWSQQAYLKASNAGMDDYFGASVAISGETVVVGAFYEDSSTTGVNNAPDENAFNAGAAYVFTRSGTTWSQQAYLKASNTLRDANFGISVAVSGETVVVGADLESSSGAAYVFTRSGTTWSQQAYLKASNAGGSDRFGNSVAVSGDTLAIGAYGEDSSTTGVNSIPNEGAGSSGAAYVFTRSGTTWSQQAYLKASNTDTLDSFGYSVAVSGDTVVVGASGEDSSSVGVNSMPNNSAIDSGAAYVFIRSGTAWSQQAYLKASNTGSSDSFGWSVALASDTIAIGAFGEDSSTTGMNSVSNENASTSGAAYVFTRSGTTWSQQAYLKASNTGVVDQFGNSVAVAGDTVIVGASGEDSSTSTINSIPNENGTASGAVYLFTGLGPVPTLTGASPATGNISGGTSVNLTGTNLTGASAVSFDGIPAAIFTVNSATSITAMTPAHAVGAVDVAVTTSVGTATGTNLFTYTSPDIAVEAPTGTMVAAGNQTLAFPTASPGQFQDQSITLQNTGNIDLTSIIISITGDDAGQFSLASSPPTTLSPAGSAPFIIRFSPTSVGQKNAVLTIVSNDPDESPFIMNLSGLCNSLPTYAGYSATTQAGVPITLSFAKLKTKAYDADGEILTITSQASSAQGGTISAQATGLLYTPPAGFVGTDSFPLFVQDPHPGIDGMGSGTVTINVTAPAGGGGGGGTAIINPPVLTMNPGGTVGLSFQGIPGRNYLVQRTIDMTNWSTLATLTADASGHISYTDPSPPPGSAFYRFVKP